MDKGFAIAAAVCAGAPAIENNEEEVPIQNRVYEETSRLTSIRTHSINQYVPVDGCLKGCPMGERDLERDQLRLLCEQLVRAYDPCFSCSVH